MSTSDPLLRLIVADSDTAHAQFLADLNRPDSGVISVRARPATRRTGWLSKDVLAALGKRFDVSGSARNDQEYTSVVPVWLTAHGIKDVVVSGVEVLSVDHLHHLAVLAHGCAVRLWLVVDHVASEAVRDLASAWPIQPWSRRDFDTHWSDLSSDVDPPANDASSGRVWPTAVPSADFPVFLAEVTARLAAIDADMVAAAFTDAFTEASQALEAGDDADLTEDNMADMIRALLHGSTTRAEMVTRVRAFQAAAFRHRWLVLVDLDTFLSSGTDHLAAVAAEPDTWLSLRAYSQPYRAAACALVAAGLDLDSLEDLRLGHLLSGSLAVDLGLAHLLDLTAGAAALSDAVHDVELPRGSEVFVRALAEQRLAEAASPDDLLFGVNSESIGARRLGRALDAAGTELGLVFSAGPIRRKTETPRQWRQRHGLSVQRLDPPKRRSSR